MRIEERAYEMRQKGMTFQAIADELGCAHTTAQRYCDRMTVLAGGKVKRKPKGNKEFIVYHDPTDTYKSALRFGEWQAARFNLTDVATSMAYHAWANGMQFVSDGVVYTVENYCLVGDNGYVYKLLIDEPTSPYILVTSTIRFAIRGI